MSRNTHFDQSPLKNPVDILLADIAIRLQLSRSAHREAVERYKSIQQWIDRAASPLRNRVELCYPQGSMAIQATVASRLTTDEHDLDIVAELRLTQDVSPKIPLDLLYEALTGQPGSRYWRKTRRRSRCVTIKYDNMHIDVTPSVRLNPSPPKESLIFHHSQSISGSDCYPITANPFGFADWFNSQVPIDERFAEAFARQVQSYESNAQPQAAEAVPVPPQEPAEKKSILAIILQLLKRWRNVKYEPRQDRRPPSVMIAALVAQAEVGGTSLLNGLMDCAGLMLKELDLAQKDRKLIEVTNPVCKVDIFTDRWPGSLHPQEMFRSDLIELLDKLKELQQGCPLDRIRQIMEELFGESPTGSVFEAFNRRSGESIRSGRSWHDPIKGEFVMAPSVTGPTQGRKHDSRRTPRHNFYGRKD